MVAGARLPLNTCPEIQPPGAMVPGSPHNRSATADARLRTRKPLAGLDDRSESVSHTPLAHGKREGVGPRDRHRLSGCAAQQPNQNLAETERALIRFAETARVSYVTIPVATGECGVYCSGSLHAHRTAAAMNALK